MVNFSLHFDELNHRYFSLKYLRLNLNELASAQLFILAISLLEISEVSALYDCMTYTEACHQHIEQVLVHH